MTPHRADWNQPPELDHVRLGLPVVAHDVTGAPVTLRPGDVLRRAGYCPELGQWLAIALGPCDRLVRFDAPDETAWYLPWYSETPWDGRSPIDDGPEPPDPYHEWDCR